MISTRRVILSAGLLVMIRPAASIAQGPAAIGAISIAIGAAADALGKVATNIETAIASGRRSWDLATARLARDRMLSLSKTATQVYAVRNVSVIDSLDQYLATWGRGYNVSTGKLSPGVMEQLTESWSLVRQSIERELTGLSELTSELDSEKSSFIAQDAYIDLRDNISAKSTTLRNLRNLDAPIKRADVEQLRALSLNFDRLHEGLRKVITELNSYIRTL